MSTTMAATTHERDLLAQLEYQLLMCEKHQSKCVRKKFIDVLMPTIKQTCIMHIPIMMYPLRKTISIFDFGLSCVNLSLWLLAWWFTQKHQSHKLEVTQVQYLPWAKLHFINHYLSLMDTKQNKKYQQLNAHQPNLHATTISIALIILLRFKNGSFVSF